MVLAPARNPPPLQQAPRRRADDRLRRRNPGIVDESGRLVACPGRTSHRRAVSADAPYSGPQRHALRHPRRASRWEIQLHAADLPSAFRPAPAPDGHIPGDRVMTSPLLWTLIAVQLALGLFDIIYHHEMMERLAWRASQRRELKLHGARNLAYAALFLGLGLFELK